MNVTAISLAPNELWMKRGNMKGHELTVKVRKGDVRTFIVTKAFPRMNLRGKVKKMYAVVMDGEPRSLSYMDDFDSDAFEAFTLNVLERLEDPEDSFDSTKALKELFSWSGPDNQIEGLQAEPWLLRRFRASPVTDEHLHRVITDHETAKLMKGEPVPLWIFALVAMAIAMVALAVTVYALVSAPPVIIQGDDFEVIDNVARWLLGR